MLTLDISYNIRVLCKFNINECYNVEFHFKFIKQVYISAFGWINELDRPLWTFKWCGKKVLQLARRFHVDLASCPENNMENGGNRDPGVVLYICLHNSQQIQIHKLPNKWNMIHSPFTMKHLWFCPFHKPCSYVFIHTLISEFYDWIIWAIEG